MTDRFRLLLAAVLPAALVISVSAVAQVFTTPPVPPGQLPPGAAAPPPPGAMQSQNQNPTCMRLEGQLAAVERGFADPARAAQVRRAEDAVNSSL